MKPYKLLAVAAALLAVLASCQEKAIETTDVTGEELCPVTLTACFDETKVSYTETGDMNLKPAWEIGDEIIGFDSNKTNYKLTVTKIDGNGIATLKGDCPLNCTLHLIYLRNASKDDIVNGTLQINYRFQKCDGTMPAVMLADGDVVLGEGFFQFHNAGAVVGIDAVKGVPNGSTICKILINGDNLGEATVALDGSNKLHLTTKTESNDWLFSGNDLNGLTVVDADGTLSRPVMFAVPAGATISEVSVKADNDFYSFPLSSKRTLSANQYSYVTSQSFEKLGYVNVRSHKWGFENLAISASGKREFNHTGHVNGDYFQWGAHAGYCGSSSDSDKGLLIYNSFTSTCCGDGADAMSFKAAGSGKNYHFQVVDEKPGPADEKYGCDMVGIAPYFEHTYYGGNLDWYLFTKYKIGYSPEPDNKKILEKTDDVANILLGGKWRMPDNNEYSAMMAATYWEWDSTDKGYYVFTPDSAADAGRVNGGSGSYNKQYSLMFFPATGWGFGFRDGLSDVGLNANYWTRNLCETTPSLLASFNFQAAMDLNFYGGAVLYGYSVGRFAGFTIRPVTD